jgi:hypothetical protein
VARRGLGAQHLRREPKELKRFLPGVRPRQPPSVLQEIPRWLKRQGLRASIPQGTNFVSKAPRIAIRPELRLIMIASSDRYPCLDHTPHLLRSSGFQFQISGFRARAPPSVQLASRRPVWRAGGLEAGGGDRRPEVERVALNTLAWRGGTADSIQRLGGKTLHLRSTPDRGQRPRLQRTRTRPIVARRSRAVLVAGLAEAGSEIRAPLSA